MSLPSLAFMAAQSLRRRAQQPGMQTMVPPPEEDGLAAFLREDENPLRVPTMRAEDPDFLKHQLEPLDEEQKGLQGQLEQAQAMMAGGGNRATTPLGAAIGGIADLIRGGVGAYRQKGLQAQMASLGQRRAEAVEAFGRNPSESAVPRDESRKGRLLQRALQANQQAFQGGENEKGRVLQRTLEGMQDARARKAAEAKAKSDLEQSETGLRKEIMANQIVKDYQLSLVARDGLRAAAKDPSPAGDLAIVFGTMQALDPGSVVKENEQIQVQNATNLPDRALNYISRINSGQRLTPEQRQDLISMANGQVTARAGVVRQIYAGYEPIIQRGGMNRGNVLPFMLEEEAAASAGRAPSSPIRPKAQALPPARGGVVGPGDARSIKEKRSMPNGATAIIYADGTVEIEE